MLDRKHIRKNKLNANTKNIKKTWQILNHLLRKNIQQKQCISSLEEGKVISNNVDVDNALNNHFFKHS